MKAKLTKFYCWLFGHDFTTIKLTNGQSYFGTHQCHRCGYQKDWQYDL